MAPGQFSSNPTAPPLAKRDLDGEVLHVRSDGAVSTDEFVVLANSMERNQDARKDILKTLTSSPEVKKMTSDLIKKYVSDSDGKITFENMKGLAEAMQNDSKAERAVLKAFNKNVQIAKVTKGLFDKWSTPEDIVKRDPEEEFAYLAARHIDNQLQFLGLAKRDFDDDDDLFTLEARDPEADAEAEFDFGFEFETEDY